MKRIFTVLSVVAIANLLGVLGFIGWLVASARLNRERVDAIREVLSEPIPLEKERLEREHLEADAELAGLPEPLPDSPPIASEQLVNLRTDQALAGEFRNQRLERETSDLARTMTLERRRLDRERNEFQTQRAQFDLMREQIAAIEGEAQFKKALSVLKEVKPADAKAMLQQIIEGQAGLMAGGETEGVSGMDRAVAFLDAMGSMERGEIMSQFVKDSPAMAAELLERLRTFGLVVDASGEQAP